LITLTDLLGNLTHFQVFGPYLKPKDFDTKNPSKYRPITCLPTLYKIMTSCIKVIIYDHCQKLNILNEEQKGCVKECFGCKEQLIIDTITMTPTYELFELLGGQGHGLVTSGDW
jgi:hypothetical protein